MILAALLTILIDGSPVQSSFPARIVAGRAMAPLDPIVTRIADLVSLTERGTIEIERGRYHVSLAMPPGAQCMDCVYYVPLATIVRALGGTVRFDAQAKCLEISFAPPEVRTPQPYDILAPPVPPSTVLSGPPTPSPSPIAEGTPHPRRTPVEVRIPGS
jgi:hypothetical protein